jgi:opacity protein-like surface antigen
MKQLLLALLATACAAGATHAQSATPYIGVGVLSAHHDFVVSTSQADDRKTGAKLFGGVDFNQTWGVEAGYTDFGRVHATLDLPPGGMRMGMHNTFTYVAAKATMPLNAQFAVVAKLGVGRNKLDLEGAPISAFRSKHETDGYGALAVQYQLSKEVALSAEYERYGSRHTFGVKPDAFGIAATYRF